MRVGSGIATLGEGVAGNPPRGVVAVWVMAVVTLLGVGAQPLGTGAAIEVGL